MSLFIFIIFSILIFLNSSNRDKWRILGERGIFLERRESKRGEREKKKNRGKVGNFSWRKRHHFCGRNTGVSWGRRIGNRGGRLGDL